MVPTAALFMVIPEPGGGFRSHQTDHEGRCCLASEKSAFFLFHPPRCPPPGGSKCPFPRLLANEIVGTGLAVATPFV